MKIINNLVLGAISLTIIACGQGYEKNNGEVEKKVDMKEMSTTTISQAEELEVKIAKNPDGGLWIVNEPTQIGMTKMIEMIEAFNSNEYLSLGKGCQDQLNYITSNCDMKGQAHDELHKVLLPIIDEVSSLQDSSHFDHGKEHVESLQKLLNLYFDNFKNLKK